MLEKGAFSKRRCGRRRRLSVLLVPMSRDEHHGLSGSAEWARNRHTSPGSGEGERYDRAVCSENGSLLLTYAEGGSPFLPLADNAEKK